MIVSIVFFALTIILGIAFYIALIGESKEEELQDLQNKANKSERKNSKLREQMKNFN